ncbi:hypothetical protein P7C70_g5967, partial [Phenoliferia sp. Uapishka_3]
MSTQPRILVKAGSSLASLTEVSVNGSPHDVSSSRFEGSVGVRIEHWLGATSSSPSSPEAPFQDGATFSIVINGRFKEEIKAHEVLWGNEWDNPIRESLPYGTSAALKFVHFVDPTLTHDIYADKPWALSPLLSTVNFLSLTKIKPDDPLPAFDYQVPEDISTVADAPELKGQPAKRKTWLSDAKNKEKIILGPDLLVATDFCNGYIDFKTLSLKIPGGLHFALQHMWDGQPVRFVCRTEDGKRSFFFVTLQIVEEGSGEPAVPKKQEAKKEAAPPSNAADDAAKAAQEDALGVD